MNNYKGSEKIVEKLFNVEEAAILLKMKPATLRIKCREKKIGFYRPSKIYVFNEKHIQDYWEKN